MSQLSLYPWQRLALSSGLREHVCSIALNDQEKSKASGWVLGMQRWVKMLVLYLVGAAFSRRDSPKEGVCKQGRDGRTETAARESQRGAV